mgnify:CR=1 FL=1
MTGQMYRGEIHGSFTRGLAIIRWARMKRNCLTLNECWQRKYRLSIWNFPFSDATHGILINHKIDERTVDPVWRAIKIEKNKNEKKTILMDTFMPYLIVKSKLWKLVSFYLIGLRTAKQKWRQNVEFQFLFLSSSSV